MTPDVVPSRWFILRTSGGHTLSLARSLGDAGFNVWTPARTIRRILRAKTATGTRQIEVDVPILPTFVFARESDLAALAHAAALSISPHPAFSIFRHGGRIPLLGEGEIAGLQEEERRAAAKIQAMRDAESQEEAQRIRNAAIKSEASRRRASKRLEREIVARLRGQAPTFAPDAEVVVTDMPALAGVVGVVEASDRTFAAVRFGTQSWKIEAWRLMPAPLDESPAPRGLAA